MRRTCCFRRHLDQSRWAEQVLLYTCPDSDTAPPPSPCPGKAPLRVHSSAYAGGCKPRMPGFPLGIHIPNFPGPPLSLRLILSTGLQNLFARIMFIQFLTYRDETRTQLKADESPSGCQLTRGSSGRKNEVASQGFCNYPQVFFFFLLSVYFEVISNFKKICKSSPKNSHITW